MTWLGTRMTPTAAQWKFSANQKMLMAMSPPSERFGSALAPECPDPPNAPLP